MGITLATLSGIILAALAPLIVRALPQRFVGWVISLLPLGLLVYFASFIPAVARGETFNPRFAWAPSLNVYLSFYLDGLSLLFAVLISGIGAFIMIYAGGYLAGHKHLGRFYLYILLFMGSMLGVVLADNLITLFVFWELTSLSSYFLIGFEHESETARASALQALLVTGVGGLALLAGVILLGFAGGSFEISELLSAREAIVSSEYYVPILILIFLGAFTKSAQFPFHFWLPNAMEAPTPVSAYLHSATMVKAGVYLLARLNPALGQTELWTTTLTVVGATTMLVGGYLALHQTDLKRILAYSTVSALGTLTFLIGLGSTYAIKAAIVFLLAHALYKGALFMLAGAIDHGTGVRDVDRLGGLRKAMPVTAAITVLAALSLAGFGPVLSFIGKEMLLEAVLESETIRALLIVVSVLAGALFVAVAAIITIGPFFGEYKAANTVHDPPLSLLAGPFVMVSLSLIMGVFPSLVETALVAPPVASVLGRPEPIHLVLWHGFTPALALSLTSLGIGFALYRWWRIVRRVHSAFERIFVWGPSRWYEYALSGINGIAKIQTIVLQNGYLRFYVLTIIVTTLGISTYTLFRNGLSVPAIEWSPPHFYEYGIAALILLAAGAAVHSKTRLAAVAALGVVGFGVALIFVLYSAPDLAMTQILIETLTVILLVLVLHRLPRFSRFTSNAARGRDFIVATASGALMTGLVLLASNVKFHESISSYFVERSFPEAHGRNIVNVILVDFRALDTLGEITVLAIAGAGVYALLKLRVKEEESK